MTSLYHPVTGKRQNIADGNLLLRFSLLNLGWIEGESLPVDDLGENTGSFEGWQAAIDLGNPAQHMYMVRLLVENGYDTPESVQMATDAELLAIKGIGPKSLAALRAVLGAG